MHRVRRAAPALLATALALGVTMAAPSHAAARPAAAAAKPTQAKVAPSDVREIPPKKTYSTSRLTTKSVSPQARKQLRAQAAAGTPAVGTTRTLLALDDYNGILYKKPYTLQAVGDHIEVWVANDTSFPAGDCRSQVANTTTVTRAQAESLAQQFDDNMLPKESAAFSVAPDRDGSGNVVSGIDSTGDGDKVMTLVDNVRDDNYYEGVKQAPTYIAGFFSSQFNELLDRNIMTIDAFDWAHRTGPNPPDQPSTDPCTNRPAQPNLYESVFAHEYQHLLQYYIDPAEVNWVNEGLSDFARTLTGYTDETKTVFDKGNDNHVVCYQGYGTVVTPYNPIGRDCGGPENSLTLWGDQPPAGGILADYGEASSIMAYIYDHYGLSAISALHRDGTAQGLVGLQHVLDAYADGTSVYRVLHDFQVMTLVDKYVDPKGQVKGITRPRVTSKSLNSSVNLSNPAAYSRPGAPANGADYVGLRSGSGLYLDGSDLKSLSFSGASTLTPEALKWTSVTDAPGRSGNPTLWSGNTSNLDATAITPVTVPTSNPTLTYTERHLAEATYDYAYTVISTDGGKTYKPLSNANTVNGPYGPALNGDAAGFTTQTFDLSPYAGKNVLIGFRYVSDGGTNDGGWYVDDVKVGGTTISDGSEASVFKSSTQVSPVKVAAWNVRLVGLDAAGHRIKVKEFASRAFSLSSTDVAAFAKYPRVVAIVSYDEPTEQYQPQALYTLKVNGVVQPGGGQSAGVAVKADRF